MQDRALNRRGFVAAVACAAVWIATVMCAQERSHKPRGAKPPETGFRLVPVPDLVYLPKYLPKPEEPRGGAPHKKRAGMTGFGGPRAGTSVNIPVHEYVFQVLSDGKGPENGFFNVRGKPVAPVWKSSNPSVLAITTNARDKPSFAIHGPGKTTVTVSVGDWSDHADLEIVNSPISMGTSSHDLLKQHGYPTEKYITKEVPRGCCTVYWGGNGAPSLKVGIGPSYTASGGVVEFWEYQQWPRCLIVIMGGAVVEMATRPAEKGDAARPAASLPAKSPTESSEPKAGESGKEAPATGKS